MKIPFHNKCWAFKLLFSLLTVIKINSANIFRKKKKKKVLFRLLSSLCACLFVTLYFELTKKKKITKHSGNSPLKQPHDCKNSCCSFSFLIQGRCWTAQLKILWILNWFSLHKICPRCGGSILCNNFINGLHNGTQCTFFTFSLCRWH